MSATTVVLRLVFGTEPILLLAILEGIEPKVSSCSLFIILRSRKFAAETVFNFAHRSWGVLLQNLQSVKGENAFHILFSRFRN